MRDLSPAPRGGTVFVQGTTTTANVVKVLPQLDERGLNVKIVAASARSCSRCRTRRTASAFARWATDGTAWPSPTARGKLMRHWIGGPLARDYSLSSDWDDRWRTGGTVDEVIDEAHLGPDHIVEAIQRYAADRADRHRRLRAVVDAIDGGA